MTRPVTERKNNSGYIKIKHASSSDKYFIKLLLGVMMLAKLVVWKACQKSHAVSADKKSLDNQKKDGVYIVHAGSNNFIVQSCNTWFSIFHRRHSQWLVKISYYCNHFKRIKLLAFSVEHAFYYFYTVNIYYL